jgi:hypothetical protein
MKFKKWSYEDGSGKCFYSDCGEYHVVNYGKGSPDFKDGRHIFCFVKADFKTGGKTYRQFGNSVEKDRFGNSMRYRTYREAFKAAERHKFNQGLNNGKSTA